MRTSLKKEGFLSGRSKTIWKFFLLVFLINIIVLNWSDVSWLFNYKVAPKGIQSVVSQTSEREYADEDDSVEVAAIGVKAPLIIPAGESDAEIYDALKKGVAHFPTSSLPGEKGIMILLGHSSPPGWPKIDYDWVFTEAELLEPGDEVRIVFDGRIFTYVVTEKIFLEIGQDVPSYDSDEREMILLSCWPPGKNIKRIGIRGVLI